MTTAIEQKIMENLRIDDDIAKLIFTTDYVFARQMFNLNHIGVHHNADYAISWIILYLIDKCGYKRR